MNSATILVRRAFGRPTLVFCHLLRRKEAEKNKKTVSKTQEVNKKTCKICFAQPDCPLFFGRSNSDQSHGQVSNPVRRLPAPARAPRLRCPRRFRCPRRLRPWRPCEAWALKSWWPPPVCKLQVGKKHKVLASHLKWVIEVLELRLVEF